MGNPDDIHSHNKETRREYEKSLNLQEIIHNIIYDNEMLFIREFLKEQFPLEDMFIEIDKSIDALNNIETRDSTYDSQEYEELRNFQYADIIKIYDELYLHSHYSKFENNQLGGIYHHLSTKYIQKLTKINSEAKIKDPSLKKSDLKYLLVFVKNFFIKFKIYVDSQLEGKLRINKYAGKSSASGINLNAVDQKVQEIDNLNAEILKKLEKPGNERFRDIIIQANSKNSEDGFEADDSFL